MATGKPTRQHEFECLCERCGYVIDGLPHDANCPECGRPVAKSDPGARPGSAWQQSPSPRSFARTNLSTIIAPLRSMRRMAIEPSRARSLRSWNIRTAATILVPGSALVIVVQMARARAPHLVQDSIEPLTRSPLGVALLAAGVGIGWMLAIGVLDGLTRMEGWGIRFFGRVHRSRITRTVAEAITAHATVGWIVGAGLACLFLALGLVMHEHAMRNNVGGVRGVLMLAPLWLPLLGSFLGLLLFETLVYVGVLTCRFANRTRLPPPASESARSAPRVDPRQTAAQAPPPEPGP